jgi:hypothetical protein
VQNLKRFTSPLILFLLYIPVVCSAGIYELDFDFGYDRQIYGTSRQNSVISRNYSVGFSSYLFDLTALDFNLANSQDITSENDRYTVATGYDVVAHQNRVKTNVYGVGIKQMLAGRGSRIIPVISVGYAREFVTSSGDITVENTSSLARSMVNLKETKQRYNSVFGAFSLQLKLTDRFSLKGTVKTIFPAFEFNKARDNVKYSAGFSWIF